MENLCKAGKTVLRMEQAQRRRRSKAAKDNIRTAAHGGTGVIERMQLFPLLRDREECTLDKNKEKLLRNALQLADEKLGIERQDSDILPFPVNIISGFARVEAFVKQLNPDSETMLVQDEDKIRIAIKHRYNTRNTLYYIPVFPLYLLLRQNKKCGELLVSVCSYLVRFACIPYHGDRSTYMYWQYEMLREWILYDEDAWDKDSFKLNEKELRSAEIIGDIMGRKFFSHAPLARLEFMIRAFIPTSAFEMECKRIADIAFRLWKQYPGVNIWDNMVPYQSSDPDEGCIHPEKYISFVHGFDGWLGEMMMEAVNNELNEYGSIAEPEAYNILDNTGEEPKKIDFEVKLFDLINRLCCLF